MNSTLSFYKFQSGTFLLRVPKALIFTEKSRLISFQNSVSSDYERIINAFVFWSDGQTKVKPFQRVYSDVHNYSLSLSSQN